MIDREETIQDDFLKTIYQKRMRHERITPAEALRLYQHPNLFELGHVANLINRQVNGDVVYYNKNRHINPTNICVMSCKFCSFQKKPGDAGAYALSIDEVVERAKEVYEKGIREVHMVGGLHPRWKLETFEDMIRAIKASLPALHVKAFTAVEIDWLAKKARCSTEEVLGRLKKAGLDSMPGGGAEIFHPEIREQICDTKTDAAAWLKIHAEAHAQGIRSNATMLYGHIENLWHRVDHMNRLRELQDQTEGFNVFIPLSFQPQSNQMGKERYTFGEDDLRNLAVARIFLDNFRNIKAYWIMLGQEIAQLGLHFGANDLDGTIEDEKISHAAGGRSGKGMSESELRSMISSIGKIPVQRDTLYHPLEEVPSQTLDNGLSIPRVDPAPKVDVCSKQDASIAAEPHFYAYQKDQSFFQNLYNLSQLKQAAMDYTTLETFRDRERASNPLTDPALKVVSVLPFLGVQTIYCEPSQAESLRTEIQLSRAWNERPQP